MIEYSRLMKTFMFKNVYVKTNWLNLIRLEIESSLDVRGRSTLVNVMIVH